MPHPSYEAGPWTDFPAWARVADVTSIALVVVAATIAISGGFRTRVGAVHVALTSPGRLLLWAAAIVALRHAFVRRQSATTYLVARMAAARRSEAVRASAGVTLVTRLVMFAVGYLALLTLGYAPGAAPFHEFSSELLNLPLRWDAGWYLQIATGGYQFVRDAGPDLQQNVVFFPAYPMVVRAVALLFGNSMGAYVLGGTVASVALFGVGLAYVFRIGRRVLDEERTTAALWLMATYPFAIFFGAIYSESLFLAAAAGAFDHLQRHEWRRAAAWAFVLGLARPPGGLVALPLAVAVFDEARRTRLWRAPAILVAVMPLAGVACYSLFVWHLTGSPLAWASGHAAWGRHYTGLTRLVSDRYNFIATAGVATYVRERPYDLLNTLGLVVSLASIVPLATRFSPALALLVAVDVLPGAAVGGMLSMGRFSSVAFPVFLWLAYAVPARQRTAWIAGFASLQALAAALFYTWRPLF